MFRHLFPFRRLLATSFLLVFVNVLAGQCWCATRQQPAARATAKTAAPAPMAPDHACCRAAAARKATAGMTKQRAATREKQPKSDDCCRKKAAALVATPHKPGHQAVLPLAPAVLPETVAPNMRPLAGQWSRTLPVQLVPPRHLPPKIPDIRIFIQSLTV